MSLVDIGANLTHDSFDADRAVVIQRAQAAGVAQLVVTGATRQGSRDALALATQMPSVLFATAGVHPHHASEYDDQVDQDLRELTRSDTVVAVGECGLDYFRNYSPRPDQIGAFERQIDIAAETKLPLFLHQRDAHDDFLRIIGPRMPDLSRAVAHCFTGGEIELRAYIELDLYIGVTGWICDERRGMHLRDIAKLIPDDRLMLETDAPYLLPRTIRPKPKSRRNEPAFLPEVLRVVAESRGQTEEHVARITTQNASQFFSLPAPPA